MGTTPGRDEQRFPGFDAIEQLPTWDPVTEAVVMARVGPQPPLRYFSPDEEATARALLDRLLAQDSEPRVPVLEMVDQRLSEGAIDGWRYEDMPEDGEAWRVSLARLDDEARSRTGSSFSEMSREKQGGLIEEVRLHSGDWHGLPAARLFSLWMRYATTAFYSHPWAWNEIGFGGPAYPRGYKNIGLDRREPWEVAERDASDPVPWAQRAEAARRRHRSLIDSDSGEQE